MYEIIITAMGGEGSARLDNGIRLPAPLDDVVKAVTGAGITKPYIAYSYSFRLEGLNGKITEPRQIGELNAFAERFSELSEYERVILESAAEITGCRSIGDCDRILHNLDAFEVTPGAGDYRNPIRAGVHNGRDDDAMNQNKPECPTTGQKRTVTKTLKQLITELEPQHRRDQALMGECIEGLTEYAAGQAWFSPSSPKIAEMRDFIDRMATYWGISADAGFNPAAGYMQPFDDRIAAARSDNLPAADVERHAGSVMNGLYRYGEDMISCAGSDEKEYILKICGLMQEIAAAWGIESPHADRLEYEAQRLDGPTMAGM